MKKYTSYITPALILLVLAAWISRSHIRNLFPPKMKFAGTPLRTIDDNRLLSVNDLKGNVLIVSCFQTWCVDCARETPVLNELAAAIQSPAFKVVYITDESPEKIAAFRKRFASENILFTQASTQLSDLGISVYPSTFLLDKKGTVVKTKLEGYDWMKEEAAIRELITD